MTRGTVVRVNLPRPQGAPGREQFGERPAIVVQNENDFADLSTVLVVPLTSKMKAAKFRGTIRIQPSRQNGLSQPSVALTHQVRAIDRQRIKGTLGGLSNDDLALLDVELRNLLDL